MRPLCKGGKSRLFFLQNTKAGFWIVGGLMTLLYATVIGVLVYFLTNDPIWGWVVFGLTFLIIGAF